MDIMLMILFGMLISIMYTLVNGLLNVSLVNNIKWGIKVKLKDFRGNKSPIYALEVNHLKDAYTVARYDLKWHKNFPMWSIYFIPFLFLFKIYGYQKNYYKYGRFTKEDIRNGLPNKPLNSIWEDEYKMDTNIQNEKNTINNELSDALDIKNKEFNENYK